MYIASEIEQKITPSLANSSLNVVAIETLSNTSSIATLANRFCSFKGIPKRLSKVRYSGSISSKEPKLAFFLELNSI